MLRELKGTQRLPRVLAFRIDGTGTASILEGAFDASLVDNGVGDYTLNFNTPFARVPVVSLSPIASAGDVILCIKVVSASALQINAFDATDGTTAKDCDFHAIVHGFDSVDAT